MNTDLAYNELLLNNISAERGVCLANHSTFKIGGECDLAVFPTNKEELVLSLDILKKHNVKHRVIGRGSNILFADEGFDGALVFTSRMCAVSVNDKTVYAESGATMKAVALAAAKAGLSGLEFAHGIPGSIGGGVYMNAGAYGGELSNALVYSEYYDTENNVFGRFEYDDHAFRYRHSVYSDRPELIVVGACFALESGDPEAIKGQIDEYMRKRKSTQPLEYPNAGSAFKRPVGDFAARLIDVSGLKGHSVGGAQVSEKHAGFIVNKGGATAADVLLLMENIKEVVYKKHGILLESEIEYVK